jgi:uncharacterized protein (TIGR00255 family)
MILSMTGYGTGSAQKNETAVSVEIRAVNHRFLDLHIRIAREYLFLEGEIQQLVRGALDRGRVDVSATIQKADSASGLVNYSLVRDYLEAAGRLKDEFHLQDSVDLKTLLGLPGVLQNTESVRPEESEEISGLLRESVRAALEGVLRMRRQEGEALHAEMLRYLGAMQENVRRISELSAHSTAECLEKLTRRLAGLMPQGGLDPQRLVQEAALIADKCDISEEIARLRSHIEQYRALMDAEEKAGKKLDFLLQELQREVNTILSKSGNLEIGRHAIAIKADIEKLREQVQNVE